MDRPLSEIDHYNAQAAIQQQGVQAQTLASYPQMYENQQQHQAVLVEQTNPSKVIDEIVLSLSGYEYKFDGSLEKVGEPVVNQFGINRLRFIMRSIINQNTVLSHLEEREVNKLIIQLTDDIIDDLTLNWKEYGIKDKIMLDYVVDSIMFPSYMALKRALEQNEKNWLGKISVENITNAPRMPQAKQGGFWNKLKL